MHPFRISLTADRLLCFASWLSTGRNNDVVGEFQLQSASPGMCVTLDIPELVFEQHDLVIRRQLGKTLEDQARFSRTYEGYG